MKSEEMRIFVTAKIHMASIDLLASKGPFHRNQLLHVVQSFLAIVLQCLYLMYDANTTREYMNSICLTGLGVGVYIAYWSAIFQTTTIYDFADYYETVVNGRKFYVIFCHCLKH